jgi:DNA-binding transcriptional MerR regulator
MAKVIDHFTTRDLTRFAGLSKYMVDYLCRCGLLEPTLSPSRRRGLRRRFAYTDLLLARAIATLLGAGVSVLSLRQALETLRRKIKKVPLEVFSSRNVAIVGSKVYLAEPGQSLTDLTANGQLALHFVLDTKQISSPNDSNSSTTYKARRKS